MPSAGGGVGWTALCFCTGVIATAALPALPGTPVVGLLAVTVIVSLRWRHLRPLGALAAGVAWFSLAAGTIQQQAWPPERADETVELVGQVAALPVQRGGRARLEFELDSIDGAPASGRVLLSWYRPQEWFRSGERWRLLARLEPPRGRANPGLFDYERYLFARGITALGTIIDAERLEAAGWHGATDRFRQRFADWLQAETADLDAAALQRALTVADRSAMSPELAEQLRRTGTAHLLSISGLHVGMVAGLFGLLAAAVATPLSGRFGAAGRKRVVLVAGLIGAFGYAALAGFTLPTVRALIMLAAGFGAMLWRRPLQPGRALLVALTAVLLLDPVSVLSIGFWLSFGAVSVLIWSFAGRSAGRGWVSGLIRAQAVVAIGLLPLNVGVFGQWAPTALVANLVAIPLVGLWVLPCLLLSLAAFAAGGPVAALAAAGAEAGLSIFLALLDSLTALDARLVTFAKPTGPAPGLLATALAFIGALWLLAPRGWPMRPAGAVLLLPLLWPPTETPRRGEFDLRVPDLGDGQAVVIRTATQTWLYGTGPGDGAARSLVPGTLAPVVRQAGARGVDVLAVPFEHRDYAGGLAAARAAWPEAIVIAPGSGCTAGRSWRIDGVRFRVLHPSAALPDLGGDSSCVLEVRSAAGSVLLSGGIGAVVGARLAPRASPVDVLVLPRAGHREAANSAWLRSLRPEIAIATVAPYHRRGLPHGETVERVRAAGGQVLTTGGCGQLQLRFRHGKRPDLAAHRLAHPRVWQPETRCRYAPTGSAEAVPDG